jgi:hypothetical protein
MASWLTHCGAECYVWRPTDAEDVLNVLAPPPPRGRTVAQHLDELTEGT